jgi:hypothetical protein
MTGTGAVYYYDKPRAAITALFRSMKARDENL